MNKVILMGRLTKRSEVRYTSGENSLAIARYTLAVDRKIRKDGDTTADFIPCVVFGRSAEFVEKYFRKGLKITIAGRIQTGSYTNRDGQKVYTTEVVVGRTGICRKQRLWIWQQSAECSTTITRCGTRWFHEYTGWN